MAERILITNDDGIASAGLIRLAEGAKELGEVWVVAPGDQRSAVSHSITLRSHIDVSPADFPLPFVKAYKCSGTPADCVRVGMLNILPEKPSIVLSGINYGYNVASDVQYSATVGAALEASFQGAVGIALSEDACDIHDAEDSFLEEILSRLVKMPLPRGAIWNVNFPGCRKEDCKGILWDRKVSKGMIYRDTYDVLDRLPDGGVRLMVRGHYNEEAEEGTDFRAVLDGYTSVGMVKNVG